MSLVSALLNILAHTKPQNEQFLELHVWAVLMVHPQCSLTSTHAHFADYVHFIALYYVRAMCWIIVTNSVTAYDAHGRGFDGF